MVVVVADHHQDWQHRIGQGHEAPVQGSAKGWTEPYRNCAFVSQTVRVTVPKIVDNQNAGSQPSNGTSQDNGWGWSHDVVVVVVMVAENQMGNHEGGHQSKVDKDKNVGQSPIGNGNMRQSNVSEGIRSTGVGNGIKDTAEYQKPQCRLVRQGGGCGGLVKEANSQDKGGSQCDCGSRGGLPWA